MKAIPFNEGVSKKLIAKNKRAGHDYQLLEKVEAGIVLKGTEVKSLRLGKANLSDSFVTIDDDLEAWVHNLSIAPYELGSYANHEEKRKRKLLLHKRQILSLQKSIDSKGLSAVPLSLYFSDGKAKLEVALGKGKKLYDKRQDKMKKDVERKLKQRNWNV